MWWITACHVVSYLNFLPGNGNPSLVSPLVGACELSTDSLQASGGASLHTSELNQLER